MAFAGKLFELGQRRSSAVARALQPRAPWPFRHPFLCLGCALLIVDVVVLPVAYAGVVEVPSAIRGAGVLGGAALFLILVACALVKAWWRATRALWDGARRSSFLAGVVTACGLVVALSAYLFACTIASVSPASLGTSTRFLAER